MNRILWSYFIILRIMNSYFLRMNINILPRKYNCSLFDRFCTILTDISLIMNTSDYFGLFLTFFWSIAIDQNHSSGNIKNSQKPAKLNTFILNNFWLILNDFEVLRTIKIDQKGNSCISEVVFKKKIFWFIFLKHESIL